eukprot:1161730-Pelagomonas_calceolata.AAC.4
MVTGLLIPSIEQNLQVFLWQSNKGKLILPLIVNPASPIFLNKPFIKRMRNHLHAELIHAISTMLWKGKGYIAVPAYEGSLTDSLRKHKKRYLQPNQT